MRRFVGLVKGFAQLAIREVAGAAFAVHRVRSLSPPCRAATKNVKTSVRRDTRVHTRTKVARRRHAGAAMGLDL